MPVLTCVVTDMDLSQFLGCIWTPIPYPRAFAVLKFQAFSSGTHGPLIDGEDGEDLGLGHNNLNHHIHSYICLILCSSLPPIHIIHTHPYTCTYTYMHTCLSPSHIHTCTHLTLSHYTPLPLTHILTYYHLLIILTLTKNINGIWYWFSV